jgi:hypothetical protein
MIFGVFTWWDGEPGLDREREQFENEQYFASSDSAGWVRG